MAEILIIALCLILNALFACFEMAFVTVTKPQLRQLSNAGVRAADRILTLRENPERTLSVIQVGITLVGMISAAVGGAGAEETFAPVLEQSFGMSENMAEAAAILIVVLPLTVLNVVLGELVPKTIALRDPVRVSVIGARWITLADRLFSPLVSFLEKATKLFLLLLPKRKGSLAVDTPAAVEIDHLSKQTQQYVLNLVGVENRRVKDVMVPWEQVNTIQDSDPLEQVTAAVIRHGHTRLPVCREGKHIGILHTKEFIAMLATATEDWRTMVRPVIEVSESELALSALRKMQSKRSHMSIVVGTDGSPKGVVTLEDVLEEVVGEIYDEDDDGRVRKLISAQSRLRSRR